MGLIYIALSAVLWSLYAVYAKYAAIDANSLAYVFYSQVAASLFSGLYAQDRRRVLRDAIRREHLPLTLGIAVFSVAHQVFFIAALSYITASMALFVFELWPTALLLVVAFMVRRDLSLELRRLAFPFALSTIGLLFIAGSTLRFDSGQLETDGSMWIGLGLAFLACVSSALTALKSRFADVVVKQPGARASATANFVSRFLSLPIVLGVGYFWGLDFMDGRAIVAGILAGFFVHSLASVLATEGIRIVQSAAAFLAYYYSPFLSLALLAFLFDEQIRDLALIGGLFIVIANIYAHAREIRRISFPIILMMSVAFCILLYVLDVEGAPLMDQLAVLGSFFAIFSSFMIQRQHARVEELARDIQEFATAQGETEPWTIGALRRFVRDEEKASFSFRLSYFNARHASDSMIIFVLYLGIVAVCLASGTQTFASVIVTIPVFVAATFITFSCFELTSDRVLLLTLQRAHRRSFEAYDIYALGFSIVASVIIFAILFAEKFGIETPLLVEVTRWSFGGGA